MLFAIDIDGTIATNGNYFARFLAQQAGLAIAENELARMVYGFEFWQHPTVQTLTHEQRSTLRQLAKAHHKDPDHQRHRVPIPGAHDALADLAQHGKVIYTTCRQPESEQLTRQWLAQYDFPSAENVFICNHYHWKYIHAHTVAQPGEMILLIDDLVEKMVPAFRTLAIQKRDMAINLAKRMAVVAIGQETPPHFAKVPFPILALPSWQAAGIAQLSTATVPQKR